MKRAEVLHSIYLEAFHSLLQAILPPRPGLRYRVLDLGSGAGTDAFEIATSRPDVDVIGLDIGSPSQEVQQLGYPNLRFIEGVDFESPNWGVRSGSFDLVRCKLLAGCVSNWSLLLERIKR